MDQQPIRYDMVGPRGHSVMVLECDLAEWVRRGYQVVGVQGERPPKPSPPLRPSEPEMTLDDVWALMEAETPADTGLPETTDEDAPDPASPPPAGAVKPKRTRKPPTE